MVLPIAAAVVHSARANDGALDSHFGTTGRMLTEFCHGCVQELNALVIQHDPADFSTPKLVGAGNVSFPAANQKFALARYLLDGKPDYKFGLSGKVFTSFGAGNTTWAGDQAFALALDSRQRLLAAGSSFFNDGQSCRFALARYLPGGQPDPDFGTEGRVLTDVNPACDLANAVVPVGSEIVAGGFSGDPGTPPTASVGRRFTVIRYTENGRLDHSFHGSGIVRTEHFVFTLPDGTKQKSRYDLLRALVVDQNGKLVAAGEAQFDGGGQLIALSRYNRDGSLDQSFGDAGRVLTPVKASGTEPFGIPASAAAIRTQPDGKLVVAGQARLADDDQVSFVTRYDSNGRLDATFSGGTIIINTSPKTARCNGAEGWEALAITAHGKLVTAGGAQGSADCWNQFALARYNPNGTMDHGFGANGVVRTFMPVDPGGFAVPAGGDAHALVVQPNGALVAGGFAIDGSVTPVKVRALARYQSGP